MSIKNRGFASMSRMRQREIASLGGKAAHKQGVAHRWTPEEAREAGRKGGKISRGGRGRQAVEEVSAVPVSGGEIHLPTSENGN